MEWQDAERQIIQANKTAKVWNLPPVFVPIENADGKVIGWKVDERYKIVLQSNPQLRKRFLGE